jgi:hypothetical protein
MSFKPEVIADSSGKWSGNALRFATRKEAESNVLDLMMRWLAVSDTRVVECEDPVNYRYVDHKLIPVPASEPHKIVTDPDAPHDNPRFKDSGNYLGPQE